MSLFSRTDQEKRDQSFPKNKKALSVLGDLSGLSLPFKDPDKNDLSRKNIIKQLDMYKQFPVRLLEESSNVLQKINRVLIKPKQRKELAELLASYIYPVVLLWYEKYQNEENSLPESGERRNTLIASIDAIQQLSTAYKLLFREHYSDDNKKYNNLAYQYGVRSLELIRLEQRLRALRYQKLPKVSWQHCNQLFFALVHHNVVDEDYELIGLIAVRKESDKLRLGGVPKSSARKLYLSIQLFGLLDVTTWPTRMFHIPDGYLDMLAGEGLKVTADNGATLKPGFLLTHYRNEMPPLFKRSDNLPAPLIQFDYTNLYNVLVKDHKEIGKQQFLEEFDESKFSRPLVNISEVDRVPVIELMIMGLTSRERRQKRHASFDDSILSVYFGFHEVNRLLQDIVAPDQARVRESRQFIDTLAMSSAVLADEQKSHMTANWTITNFSAGGLLISTEETDFSNPIQIDMLVAFTMPDNKKHPVLGFVRRLNRPHSKQVEIAIVRLSNYAETAGVQDQNELDSSTAKAAILIKDVRGEWNLIIKTSMHFLKGQPLKLIRANGSPLPVRLGEVVYAKKDFKVFELRSPGLEMAK
ncbi:MAG: hypothetical protein KAJ39_01560 [Gammaproteobacteria bacterium]|nr:hypothetical protein [Gammaproteobacteria bacterium]